MKIETAQEVMVYISNEREVHFLLRPLLLLFIFIGVWVVEGPSSGKGELY
jgi:hypothetical protein